MEIEGIEPSGAFFDDSNFPRGFSKSGEFTIAEAEILYKYGKTLRALEKGGREAMTEQEVHFVQCCRGEATAVSATELVWQKYHSLIGRKTPVSVFGSTPVVGSQSSVEHADDDLLDNIDDDI